MFWVRWAPREHCSVLFYTRGGGGNARHYCKAYKAQQCYHMCFLSVTCLIQAFYDRFYVLITVQKRESLMQKKKTNNGKEMDIRGGGKELFSGWSHLVEKA